MKYKIINIDTQIANDIKTEIMQNYTLPIQFKLFNNMIPFDATGYSVRAEMLKSDKTFIIQTNNITISKDEILFVADKDFTRISGLGRLQIILYKGDEVTGTWNINVDIKRGAISAGDIPSKNIITSLEELRNEVKNADNQKNILVNTIETEKKSVENLIQDVNKNIADANVIPTKEYSSYFKDITTTNYINDTLDCRNGYFKNVGIKGNTLINIINFKNSEVNGDGAPTITIDTIGVKAENTVQGSNVISYNTNIFKCNTEYTVFFNIDTTKIQGKNCSLGFKIGNDFAVNKQIISTTTNSINRKIKIKTPETGFVEALTIGVHTNEMIKGDYIYISNLLVLEGDWTNKQEPSCFEGIKSIGELSPIKIISNNINMANITYNNVSYNNIPFVNIKENGIDILGNEINQRICFDMYLKKNTKYIIKGKRLNNLGNKNSAVMMRIKNTDTMYGDLLDGNEFSFIFNSANENKFLLCFYTNLETIENKTFSWGDIQIIEETKNQEFVPSQRDILELDNIILSGLPNGICDIYDKNNKIIRNVDKVIFNGSENWVDNNIDSIDYFQMELVYQNGGASEKGDNRIISDKFSFGLNHGTDDKEGVSCNENKIYLKILKNKLSTPNLAGFKKWLMQNNTIVYFIKSTPTFEDIKENKSLQCFADGIVTFEDTFYPNLELTYPITFNSAMLTNSIELNNFNNIIEDNINIINTNTTNINKNTTDINKNISSINSLNTNLTNTINSFSISQSGTNTTLKMANNAKLMFYSDFFQIDSGTYPYGRDVKFETAFPNGLIGINICGRRIGSDIFGLKNSEIWNKNKEGFSFTGTMESGKAYAIEVLAIGY